MRERQIVRSAMQNAKKLSACMVWVAWLIMLHVVSFAAVIRVVTRHATLLPTRTRLHAAVIWFVTLPYARHVQDIKVHILLLVGPFGRWSAVSGGFSYRISLFLEKILGYFRYMKLRIYKCTMYHWLYVWEMTLQLQFQNVGMILIKMKLLTFMILSHKCSIVFVNVLNTFIRQGFSQVLKARKLSDLCFKRKNCQHLTNWTTCNKRDEV